MDQRRGFAAREGFRYGGEPGNGSPVPPPIPVPGEVPPPVEVAPPPSTDVSAIVAELQHSNELLGQILKELHDLEQAGYVVYVEQVANRGLIPIEITFNPSLFAISITNDGPGNVQYRVPNVGQSNWVTLRPTEVDQFTLTKGKFPSLAIRSPGATAPAVRIRGLF